MLMAGEEKNYGKLRKFAFGQGLSIFGVADITGVRDEFLLASQTVSKYDRALSLGKRLIDSVIDDINDRPTHIYFHHYRQLNFFLDRAAFFIAAYIQEQGYGALPIPASQTIDWEKQRGHLSHKKVGYLAGIGWMGRSNLLVSQELGARFRLVTMLTDMPLSTDSPLDADCGVCRKCLAVCPAQAIKKRQEDFDHLACFEKLKEFKNSGVVGQHICGVCVKACPGSIGKSKQGQKPNIQRKT